MVRGCLIHLMPGRSHHLCSSPPCEFPVIFSVLNSCLTQHRYLLAACHGIRLLPWRPLVPSFCTCCTANRSPSAPYSSSSNYCVFMGCPFVTAQIASGRRTCASNPRIALCCHRYSRWTPETYFAYHPGKCSTGYLLFPHCSFSRGKGSPWVCSILDAHCTNAPATVVSMPIMGSPGCQWWDVTCLSPIQSSKYSRGRGTDQWVLGGLVSSQDVFVCSWSSRQCLRCFGGNNPAGWHTLAIW